MSVGLSRWQEQLRSWFLQGTERTQSGQHIGLEVETDFADRSGHAITSSVTEVLLATPAPRGVTLSLETARQKIELAVSASATASEAIERAREALQWLYRTAAPLGAFPCFIPEFDSSESLLHPVTPRDEAWVRLDGRPALEHLCRCSSVQFTVDVSAGDAIPWINQLHQARLHERDYAANDRRWRAYISESLAGYLASRYGGLSGYQGLDHYVAELSSHSIVMGGAAEVDLFLRSVWWHYRLRRHGDRLCLEIRPLARRTDELLVSQWNSVARCLGLSSL